MNIRFKDSYRIVDEYINNLELKELKLLATLHNLHCVSAREEVFNALLNNEDPKDLLNHLIIDAIVKLDKIVILSKIVKDLEEA